jgi:hypothetical protein
LNDLFLNACLVRQNLIKRGFMLPLFVLDAMVCIVLIAMYGGVTKKRYRFTPSVGKWRMSKHSA